MVELHDQIATNISKKASQDNFTELAYMHKSIKKKLNLYKKYKEFKFFSRNQKHKKF